MTNTLSKIRLGVVALICCLAVGVCVLTAPAQAWAVDSSNGAKVKELKTNTTYKSFDITGDKKADKVKVSISGNDAGLPGYTKISVSVNGKTVMSKSGIYFRDLGVSVVTLKNKKPFLFLSIIAGTVGTRNQGAANLSGIYKYSGGKLKAVATPATIYPSKVGSYRIVSLAKASGNSVTLTYAVDSYSAGSIDADYTFNYKSGTLKLKSRIASVKLYDGNSHKALKTMTAYTKYDCKKKSFTIKKGQVVAFKRAFSNGKTTTMEVQCDGKTGWIKMAMSPKSALLYKNSYGRYAPPFDGIRGTW